MLTPEETQQNKKDICDNQTNAVTLETEASPIGQKQKGFGSSPKGQHGQDDPTDLLTVAEELVPTLESFDPSILEILPKKLQNLVNQRVTLLKNLKKSEEGRQSYSPNQVVEETNVVRCNTTPHHAFNEP
jgi:hypothetical protein